MQRTVACISPLHWHGCGESIGFLSHDGIWWARRLPLQEWRSSYGEDGGRDVIWIYPFLEDLANGSMAICTTPFRAFSKSAPRSGTIKSLKVFYTPRGSVR